MKWLLLGLMFLSPVAAQTPVLVEQVGLLSDVGNSNLPFSSGIPVGVVDMNGDRRDDIVRLHDAEFLNIEYQTTPGAAFGHLYHGAVADDVIFGLCVADVDANGFADIVIGDVETNVGHHLLTANSAGTSYSSVALTPVVNISQGVIFADLDNDGTLDIFACDDIGDNHKWRGMGGGSYVLQDSLLPTELTISTSSPDDDEGNYAILGTDYDNDGDIDYYLSKCRQNDASPTSKRRINRLFENNGDGTYTDIVGARGLADGNQTWAADFADIDNDGDLDCFVLNHKNSFEQSGESLLFENDGAGNFTDITEAAGLDGEVDFWGIQALFRDFNNDGWIDLLVGGMGAATQPNTYGFYLNDGDGTFTTNNTILKYSDNASVPRIHSFGVGDLNHDGFLDLYAGRARYISQLSDDRDLLLFNQGNANGFLAVTLVGNQSNHHGIGARIEAHGPWGVQVREVRGGESYGVMNSYNAHFGLGAATEVTKLRVRWPSGVVDEVLPVPGNRFVSVYEGTGAVAMSFEDWVADCFPGGGADAELNADPDHDRIPNLVEQLRGTDPKIPNGGPGLLSTIEMDEGQTYLQIAVPRVPMQDVQLEMEFSVDGVLWETPEEAEVVEDTPLRYLVRLPVNVATDRFRLARLRVRLAAP